MFEYRVVRDILGNPNWEEHILSTDSYGKAKLVAMLSIKNNCLLFSKTIVLCNHNQTIAQ